MVNIRLAREQDIQEMASLLGYLFKQEQNFTPNIQLQIQGLKEIMANKKSGQLFVLQHNNKTVAMVNLLFTVSTALGGKVAILEDMVVHPEYRSNGFGGRLINYAIDWAKNQKLKRITLLTDHDNDGAHRFYQNHGFDASGMVPFTMTI